MVDQMGNLRSTIIYLAIIKKIVQSIVSGGFFFVVPFFWKRGGGLAVGLFVFVPFW